MFNTKKILEQVLTENPEVDAIKKVIATLKVGDMTNFGKVVEVGSDWVTFKAKDTPKTTLDVKSRVIGRKDRVLSKLVKR